MKIEMHAVRDQLTGDLILALRVPDMVCRTDGEYKWRIVQAVTLALTEKEADYSGADTVEGLQGLLTQLRIK